MWLEPFLGSSSPPSSPLLPQSLLLFLTSVWKCALCVANKSTWLIMPLQFDSWLVWQVKLPVWISGTEWEETELVWSRGDGWGEESVLVGSSPLRLSILSDLCLLWCAKKQMKKHHKCSFSLRMYWLFSVKVCRVTSLLFSDTLCVNLPLGSSVRKRVGKN